MEGEDKGTVCVTGGTGFLGSWLIMKLLQQGYSVHTTIRSYPDYKKDVSYLTSLPGASTRLQIFNADLDKPDSFEAPINGCIGVFHLAHPMDPVGNEPEETVTQRSINGTLGILKACLNSKTVKRVVYTSSVATVLFNGNNSEVKDAESWSDVDYMGAVFKEFYGAYCISKTLTERAALEFAEKNGLDLVSVIPTSIHGPFICPSCPSSVRMAMAMIFGDQALYQLLINMAFVHIDDLVNAHTFLFEYPKAKGRYICSTVEVTIDKMSEFLSARYPEFQVPTTDVLMEIKGFRNPSVSSKKLVDTGFKFKYGLEEMYDGAIECCKEKGFL